MKKYEKKIAAIKTENEFKAAVIEISQATSDYKISWETFMQLRSELKALRLKKGFEWGAGI